MTVIASAVPVADVNWGHMGGWGIVSWIAMAIFWALVIVALIWVVRELAGPRSDGAPDATEILERRLAAGEIGIEEYRERRAALEGPGARPRDVES